MQNKVMGKVAAVATGLAMATSMLSLAPMAHAASLSAAQIQSIVGLLSSFGADSATIASVTAALGGSSTTTTTTTTTTTGGSASCAAITAPLMVGSSGAAVSALQDVLVAGGYLTMPAGAVKGTFGPLTKAAVMKWQMAAGVSPAAGYFGPISLAALKNSAACGASVTPTPGTTPTTPGTLSGTDGSISDVNELGSFNNEEVAEGNNDVKVLGADIEASVDGDIALKSIKVSFDSTGNTGSDNLDDYVDSVSVWLGSTKVGSADADEFSESAGVFTKTITLSGDTTIKADEIAKLYIAVDAQNTIDSGDISGDSWTVDIENIRFVDGSGVYTTDDSTGDINALNVPISFVSFSTAADTELVISTASNSPDAGIVIADDSSNTDNVSLLKGKLKLEGKSDVVLDEFPVTFTVVTSGTANGVDDIAGTVTLKIGGETYSETMTVTSALVGSVTFDNLDFAMEAGKTVEFEVLADVNDIDGTVFVAGDTLKADVTASNRDLMDVENSEGDQLSDSSEKSGTATGEAQEFRVSGIMLTLVSAETDATTGTSTGDDIGLFTIKYKVTAIGDTVYVSSLADAQTSGNTDGKTTITIDRAGTATATNISVSLVNNTDTDLTSVGLYQIEEGDSETFTVSASVPMNSGTVGQHRMSLSGVRWTTTSSDATPSNSYTSNLDSFKTAYKVLN